MTLRDKSFAFNGKFARITPNVNFKVLKQIRDEIWNEITESYPTGCASWKRQYNRGYARQQTEDLNRGSRSSEFNLTVNQNVIEFRSFNLNGVSTWEKMEDFYSIALGVIQDVFKKELRKAECFIEDFVVECVVEKEKKSTTLKDKIVVTTTSEV